MRVRELENVIWKYLKLLNSLSQEQRLEERAQSENLERGRPTGEFCD